jgi:cobalt/nickel transport system permease protein
LRVPLIFREMFMLVYRFIFIVAAISHNIFLSQRLRLGYTSARNRFRSSGGLASGVFVKSFIFGSRSYQALLARGYDGDLKVIDLKYTLSPVNWMCITAIESCFILLVIWFPI